jgi:carboxyl-terminal processing protease
LNVVVPIADYFMSEGAIINTQERGKKMEVTANANADALNMPLVILTNENSASASELFSGTMQDYGLATIVGTRTFGKGTMQTLDAPPQFDGDGVRVTIAEFFTGKGRSVKGVGVTPDVEVALTDALKQNPQSITEDNDNQLQKAIEVLRKNLSMNLDNKGNL